MKSIDAIIVSFRSRELIVAACRSALEAGATGLVVVDNASDDGTADTVERHVPEAKLIRAPVNEGFAAGVNRGLKASSAPFVLLLNPDARLQPEALTLLRDAIERSEDVAAAGPTIRTPEGALELSVGRTMSPIGDLRVQLRERAYGGGTGPLAAWIERGTKRRRSVSSLSGACLLLRRAALEDVGGMDERFFLYAEDVDLCIRLRQGGWRLLFVPEAQVSHVRGASARKDPLASEKAWKRSQLQFYRKHHPGWTGALRAWWRLRYTVRARRGSEDGRERARAMLDWLASREN